MKRKILTYIEKEAIISAIKSGEIKITGWKDCGVTICKLCSAVKKLKQIKQKGSDI